MTKISYSDKTVYIDDVNVDLDYRINDTLYIEDQELVVVKVTIRVASDGNHGRNVFGLNHDGSIRWRIQEGYGRKTKRPYHSVRYEDGQLIAKCLDSYIYDVDVETGEVTQRRRYDK